MKQFRELVAGVVLTAAIFAPSMAAQAPAAPPAGLQSPLLRVSAG